MNDNKTRETTTGDRWPAAMTRKQAAAYLGISPELLDRLRRRGDLDPVMISDTLRSMRFLRTDLDGFLSAAQRRSEIA